MPSGRLVPVLRAACRPSSWAHHRRSAHGRRRGGIKVPPHLRIVVCASCPLSGAAVPLRAVVTSPQSAARGRAPCRAPARSLGVKRAPCRAGRAALPCGGQVGSGAALAARALAGAFHAPAGFSVLSMAQRACFLALLTTSKLYLTLTLSSATIQAAKHGRCKSGVLLLCQNHEAKQGYHIFPTRVKWYPCFFTGRSAGQPMRKAL